jgi:hypothetical protein
MITPHWITQVQVARIGRGTDNRAAHGADGCAQSRIARSSADSSAACSA